MLGGEREHTFAAPTTAPRPASHAAVLASSLLRPPVLRIMKGGGTWSPVFWDERKFWWRGGDVIAAEQLGLFLEVRSLEGFSGILLQRFNAFE